MGRFFPYGSNSNNLVDEQDRITKKRRTIAIVGILAFIVIIGILFVVTQPSPEEQRQRQLTDKATKAAREHTPSAVAGNVREADGFAVSTVSDPTGQGQAKSGNTTIFKINKDGTMTQIADGSSFSVIDLSRLGMSFETQSKLYDRTVDQTKQIFAKQCGYDGGNTPGYYGFGGTFDTGWQIDSASFGRLEKKLNETIGAQNSTKDGSQKIACINALIANSSSETSKSTYISTFTFHAKFITGGGSVSDHTITFSIGPNYYRAYAIDGKEI